MIYYIEAKNKNNGKIYHWNRKTIGNIIENIPKLIKVDDFYVDIKIYER